MGIIITNITLFHLQAFNKDTTNKNTSYLVKEQAKISSFKKSNKFKFWIAYRWFGLFAFFNDQLPYYKFKKVNTVNNLLTINFQSLTKRRSNFIYKSHNIFAYRFRQLQDTNNDITHWQVTKQIIDTTNNYERCLPIYQFIKKYINKYQ